MSLIGIKLYARESASRGAAQVGVRSGRLALAAIYFTIAAIVLYLSADWLLDRIERHRGERLEHRTLIFFGILLGLALATFPLLRMLLE